MLQLIFVLLFGTVDNVYDFSFTSINGEEIKLSEFKGKNILIVNTASKCGFTPQYKELQELHETYKENLVIIGFPANNFGEQEPGSNEEISEFCEINYGVDFLLAEKVSVKGGNIHPLFKYLTSAPNPDFTGEIKWNFEKFLINPEGKLTHRYRSQVKPLDDRILKEIQ